MKELKEEQKKEAVQRMKMLKIEPTAIHEFSKKALLNISIKSVLNIRGNEIEKQIEVGALYWVEDEMLKERISAFETRLNAIVYHVIKTQFNDQTHYSFLYVSQHVDEWELDIQDLKERRPLVWVENIEMPDFSELGGITIKPSYGGLIRVLE